MFYYDIRKYLFYFCAVADEQTRSPYNPTITRRTYLQSIVQRLSLRQTNMVKRQAYNVKFFFSSIFFTSSRIPWMVLNVHLPSFSFNPALSISSLHESFHLVFCVALCLYLQRKHCVGPLRMRVASVIRRRERAPTIGADILTKRINQTKRQCHSRTVCKRSRLP